MTDNNQEFTAVYDSPVGLIGIVSDECYLHKTTFLAIRNYDGKSKKAENPIAQLTCQQLDAYFKGDLKKFDLPLCVEGTEFRKKIWQAMIDIPYGQVKSYGQVAKELASSPRAVGSACGHNHLPIIIPCHRITASAGLGGFAHNTNGEAIDMKQWLLIHEGAIKSIDDGAAEQQRLF